MICFLIGVAVSISVMIFETLNATILGIVVGYLFGNLIYNFLVKFIHINPQTLYWSTLITCVVAISIAGGFMKDYMVRIATSLVGAYAVVRVFIKFI